MRCVEHCLCAKCARGRFWCSVFVGGTVYATVIVWFVTSVYGNGPACTTNMSIVDATN